MKVILRIPLFSLFCASLLFWTTGCEDTPNTEDVGRYFDGMDISRDNITQSSFAQRAAPLAPDQEELIIGPAGDLVAESDGQIVEITLSGADGAVSWDVAFSDRGRLITRSALVATYRRDSSGDNVVSATDSSGRSVAKVIKQPDQDSPPPAEIDDLQLLPAGGQELDDDGQVVELTLNSDNQIASLRLVGAVGAVVWEVNDSTKGEMVTESNTGATYRRLQAGDNVVTARDSLGREAYKVIRQP